MTRIGNSKIGLDFASSDNIDKIQIFQNRKQINTLDPHKEKESFCFNTQKGLQHNGFIESSNGFANEIKNSNDLNQNCLNCNSLANSKEIHNQDHNKSEDELKPKPNLKLNTFFTIDERKISRKKKIPTNINNYENNVMHLPDFHPIQHPDHPNDKSQYMFSKHYQSSPKNKMNVIYPQYDHFSKFDPQQQKISQKSEDPKARKIFNEKDNFIIMNHTGRKGKEGTQNNDNLTELNSLRDSQLVLIKNMHIYSNVPDILYNNACDTQLYCRKSSLMDNIEMTKKKNQELIDMIPKNKDSSSYYIPNKIDMRFKSREDEKTRLKSENLENKINIKIQAKKKDEKNEKDQKNILCKSILTNKIEVARNIQGKGQGNIGNNDREQKFIVNKNQKSDRLNFENQNSGRAKNPSTEFNSIPLNNLHKTNPNNQNIGKECSGEEDLASNIEFQEDSKNLKNESQKNTRNYSKKNRLTKFRERRNEMQIEAITNKNISTEFNNFRVIKNQKDQGLGKVPDENVNIITPKFSSKDNSDLSSDNFLHPKQSDSFAQSLRKNIEVNHRRLSEAFEINQKSVTDYKAEFYSNRFEKQKNFCIDKIEKKEKAKDQTTSRNICQESDKESVSSHNSSLNIDKEKLNRSIKNLNKLKQELDSKKTKTNAKINCK